MAIWGALLVGLLQKLVEALLPWTVEKAKDLIDMAYEWVEQWSKDMQKEFDKKPTSEEKMTIAVALIKAAEPTLKEPAIRAMVELQHLEKTESA
jgi:hypothetical protein